MEHQRSKSRQKQKIAKKGTRLAQMIIEVSSISQMSINKQLGSIIMNGFPYDQGTKRNGGRIGGAVASKVFRQMLHQHHVFIQDTVSIYDTKDIQHQNPLQKAHQQLEAKNYQILKLFEQTHSLLFVIGGSNDQSYPNVKALLKAYPSSKIGVINLDSHFDVRPLKQGLPHSGSPFRLMLQEQTFINNDSIFVQFGCKGNTCSKQHYNYLQKKGVRIYWMEKDIRLHQFDQNQQIKTQAGSIFDGIIKQFQEKVDFIFVSFDVDSINSNYMPGVSAPNVTGGLTNLEALQICQIAGRSKKVVMVDFSEFNPAVEFNLSSRLLVEMFGNLCRSFSKRNK